MYKAVTDGISVEVTPVFLEDQSDPAQHHYVWAYQVEIKNRGEDTVQLLSRYWKITDAFGRSESSRYCRAGKPSNIRAERLSIRHLVSWKAATG